MLNNFYAKEGQTEDYNAFKILKQKERLANHSGVQKSNRNQKLGQFGDCVYYVIISGGEDIEYLYAIIPDSFVDGSKALLLLSRTFEHTDLFIER